jgi:hypothetical protein
MEIKKLATFLIVAVGILFVADRGLGLLLGRLYNRMTVGEKARANYVIRQDTSQVIVFGSSRALYHYHSGVIADSLHASVYNAGRSNQTILYDLALLKAILKRHTPKTIVLDVNEDELVGGNTRREVLSALLPYCNDDADIRSVYLHANPSYRYWSWSHTLPYNSSLFSIFYRGLTRGKDKDIHGYLEHNGVHQEPLQTIDNCSTNPALDPVFQQSFSEFIALCQAHRMALFVSVSPRFQHFKCGRPEYDALKHLAKESGVVVHDYTNLYADAGKFSDPSHLNTKGAWEFSQHVAHDVKAFLHEQR